MYKNVLIVPCAIKTALHTRWNHSAQGRALYRDTECRSYTCEHIYKKGIITKHWTYFLIGGALHGQVDI